MRVNLIYLIVFLIKFQHIIGTNGQVVYKADWAVEVPGGPETAQQIAEDYQIILKGHVSKHFGDDRKYYIYELESPDEEMLVLITAVMEIDKRIKWVDVQETLERERKSVLPVHVWKPDTSHNPAKHSKTDFNCVCKNVSASSQETFGDHVYDVISRQSDASLEHMFNDPKWPCQWELYNCGQTAGPHRVDLNVVPCWENGFTGKGVVITVVDDGLDYNNRDLKRAFDTNVSADLNDEQDKDGPLPNTKVQQNDHGTKCGGEVAMQANNNYCGVGVAHDATLGGIRFLDGVVTDTSEAAALVFNANLIDIYSCSWGPQDSGKTWEGPGRLASAALEVGAKKGRRGLGSIYVWAAGNGGAIGDNCGADGYTCSIYTIGIASVSDEGLSTFYTESCSCIMAVTLNGGPHTMPEKFTSYEPLHYLVTTDPYNGCVNTFSGTSSAAPLASGVLALVLQANPDLTWRDVQHLVAKTSKIPNPNDNGWQINGAGYHVHHKYGFGLMDAAKLVKTAQKWKNVEGQQKCEVEFPEPQRQVIGGEQTIYFGHTNACENTRNAVHKLEHVQVVMTFKAVCRGNVRISLISPCETESYLIEPRPLDDSDDAVVNWPFMSVHNWGEDPRGTWKIKVEDRVGSVAKCEDKVLDEDWLGIYIENIRLVFWGTQVENLSTTSKCSVKKEALEEAMQNLPQDNTEDPNKPLDIEHRLNEKIIKADFLGEQSDQVDAGDFKKADMQVEKEVSSSTSSKSTSKAKSSSELRQLLMKFLKDGDDLEQKSLRSDVPLKRTYRSPIVNREK